MENTEEPKILTLDQFVELLLIHLASNKKQLNLKTGKWKIQANLPADYKVVIEQILTEDNGWAEEFSTLIDLNYYFKFQNYFERDLVDEFEKFVEKWGKTITTDFRFCFVSIEFSENEVEDIARKYNYETHNKMEHFSNLVSTISMTRNSKREFEQVSREVNRKCKFRKVEGNKLVYKKR